MLVFAYNNYYSVDSCYSMTIINDSLIKLIQKNFTQNLASLINGIMIIIIIITNVDLKMDF